METSPTIQPGDFNLRLMGCWLNANNHHFPGILQALL